MLGSSWGSSQSWTDAKQNAIVTQRVAPNDALLRMLGQHYDQFGQKLANELLLGSLHKLRLHFLAFDHVPTPPSLHSLCSKCSIFLITCPPLNANVRITV